MWRIFFTIQIQKNQEFDFIRLMAMSSDGLTRSRVVGASTRPRAIGVLRRGQGNTSALKFPMFLKMFLKTMCQQFLLLCCIQSVFTLTTTPAWIRKYDFVIINARPRGDLLEMDLIVRFPLKM